MCVCACARVCVCICQLLPKTDLHNLNVKKYLENYCYILRMLIQDVANQSKLQIFLLEMEQHNLLDCYCILSYAIKKCNKQRKHRWWVHDINKNRFQQRPYHHLVKELQFDGEKFQ